MQTAYTLTVPTAKRPSRERLNNTNIIISSKNCAISSVLWVLSQRAQWHNVLAFRTSGTSRNVQGSSDTSGMTLWHTGTLVACWHTCQHSRQTHDIGRLMMICTDLPIWQTQTHRQMWSVSQFHRFIWCRWLKI